MYKLIHELSYMPWVWFILGLVIGLLVGACVVLGRYHALPKVSFKRVVVMLVAFWAVELTLIVILAVQVPFPNYMTRLMSDEVLFGQAWRMERYNMVDALSTIHAEGVGTYYLVCQPGCFVNIRVYGVDGIMRRYVPDSLTNTQYEGGLNGYYLYTIPVSTVPATIHAEYGDYRTYVFRVE